MMVPAAAAMAGPLETLPAEVVDGDVEEALIDGLAGAGFGDQGSILISSNELCQSDRLRAWKLRPAAGSLPSTFYRRTITEDPKRVTSCSGLWQACSGALRSPVTQDHWPIPTHATGARSGKTSAAGPTTSSPSLPALLD